MYLLPIATNFRLLFKKQRRKETKKSPSTPFLQKHNKTTPQQVESEKKANDFRLFIHSAIFPQHKCQTAGAYEILLLWQELRIFVTSASHNDVWTKL